MHLSPERGAMLLFFNDFPIYGQPLYSSPTLSGSGIVNKPIGSPRQIQMSLSYTFFNPELPRLRVLL
jgi:hypothetical protein